MTTTDREQTGPFSGEDVLVIDADAHVVESEETWSYMDPADQKFRPTLEPHPDNPSQQYWMIGGRRAGFRFPDLTVEALRERSRLTGRRFELPEGVSDLDDVGLRLQVMRDTQIDVQVCHNSLWIEHVADDSEVDVALCRSWNRWVAEAWKKGQGRIRWTCVVPTLDLEEASRQARYAKDNGAVGICLRPLEGDKVITDPYFYPLFEVAQDLDLPIAVHIANGNPESVRMWRSALGGLGAFRAPTVLACGSYLLSPIHQRFPRLKWAFIEASAQWLSWIVREVEQRFHERGDAFPENILQEYNVFVTCQNEDDIPYLIQQGFLDALIIGTDFGHFDPSSDVDAITKFLDNDLLSAEVKRKILSDNPKTLYGL